MTQRVDLRSIAGLAAFLAFAACSEPAPTADSAPTTGAPASEAAPETATAAAAEPAPDVVVTEASFRCIRDMTPVRGFYVDNLLGDLEATLAVAESPAGDAFPPGTLIQVVPGSAMVKHQPGRNPQTNDWEFFELAAAPDGTTIVGRGFAELNMSSGANCFTCHEPAKAAWDLICEDDHGCIPVPFTQVMLSGIQNTDPRCPTIELPPEQVEALAALAARSAPPPTPE